MDNSLRQDFLKRTISTIENLIVQARSESEIFSETFRREAFRALHTIKGTAQTIGFSAAGKFAHELENLLAAASVRPKNSDSSLQSENYKTLLVEGLHNLKKTFEETDYKIPDAFLERIGARLSRDETDDAQTNFDAIPERIFSQLTGAEKGSLASALNGEKRIFCLGINFDLTNFADEFAAFRQTLCEKCEIIATLPAVKDNAAPDRIGFQILLASGGDIEEIVEKNRAEIVFRFPPGDVLNGLESILAQTVAHGETLAAQLGKQVVFEIDADHCANITPESLNVIFGALAHLVRNAVDHAIETPEERSAQNKLPRGAIKIEFTKTENDFHLTVADDGRGVDAKKVKTCAIGKKIISSDGDLSEKETLDLIFLPEFSTRSTLTEISGRGVGLDAVKTAVEKIGGKITVESAPGKGTVFEIFLPRENLKGRETENGK